MKKVLLSLIAVASLCVAVQAQETDSRSTQEVYSKYSNSWFVGVGGGANILFDGERYTTRTLSHVGAGVALDVYAGKWLDRIVGLRVGYHGLNASNQKTVFGKTPFLYAHGDVMLRPVSWIVPYFHAGYFKMEKASIGGGVGLMLPIHVGRVSIVPDFRATGVRDGKRAYDRVAIIRCINTVDVITAEVPELDWALLKKITARILAEVPGICRVTYDLSPKPIGTVEME